MCVTSFCILSLSVSPPPLLPLTFIFHSVHTFTNRNVPHPRMNTFCWQAVTAFPPFILSPSILLFSRQALFTSNECHNLEREMISSRAFSCWTEHESLSLYCNQHAVPFGTLLATRLASLSQQIIKWRAHFLTVKIVFF